MTDTQILVFSILMSVIFMSSILSTLFVWSRLSALRNLVEEAREKATPKRLFEVEATAEALTARVDAASLENTTFRSQVHNEMQRFDQIMRRKESAVRKLESAKDSEDGEEQDGYPDTVKPDDGTVLDPAGPQTRAQLRELWKAKHGSL